MELIIVRHARPLRDDNSPDPDLAELGRQQAELVAERLATEPITHVASSSMARASQTAAPLAERRGLVVEQRDDLREIDEHRGAYVPAEQITPDHEIVTSFLEDETAIFGGPEAFARFKTQIVGAFDDIVMSNRGGTVAVFCHSGVMGVYLQHLLNLASPFAIVIDYTGIVRVTASSSGIRTVRSVNETGHVFHLLRKIGSESVDG